MFDINLLIEGNWYAYWASFSLVLFAPFFFLANLPRSNDNSSENISDIASNKFYSFLINYVALPAIFVYFFIIYAYTIKVLINFSKWPQGEVSWMVILFSFFGYIVYFASFPFKDNIKQAVIFRKILPTAVLLQTPMLFYAIWLRINQYDFTMNRYLVVVFGLWLFFLSIYYIFSKKKDFSISFYSLLIVVILISIGPWSVYSFPEKRQMTKLENNLKTAEIIQDSKIIPLDNYKDIDTGLSEDIYGEIEYIANFHGYKTLNKIFEGEIKKIEEKDREDFERQKEENLERLKKEDVSEDLIKRAKSNNYKGLNSRKLVSELSKYIKVKRWNNYNKNEEPKFLRFQNLSRRNYNLAIKVEGYDYYVPLLRSKSERDEILNELKENNSDQGENYFAIIDSEEAKFRLYIEDNLVEDADIKENIIKKILDSKDKYIEPGQNDFNLTAFLKDEDMSFEVEGKNYDMLIVFNSLSIPNPNWSQESGMEENDRNGNFLLDTRTSLIYPQGYVLIKEKTEEESE